MRHVQLHAGGSSCRGKETLLYVSEQLGPPRLGEASVRYQAVLPTKPHVVADGRVATIADLIFNCQRTLSHVRPEVEYRNDSPSHPRQSTTKVDRTLVRFWSPMRITSAGPVMPDDNTWALVDDPPIKADSIPPIDRWCSPAIPERPTLLIPLAKGADVLVCEGQFLLGIRGLAARRASDPSLQDAIYNSISGNERRTGRRSREAAALKHHAFASRIRLNGVSVARRKRVRPPWRATSRRRPSPACAPSARPTS